MHYFYFFYQILTAFNKLRIILIGYLRLDFNHCVDIFDGELFIPQGIIRPVVRASVQKLFIRYMYVWNVLFLNNVIFVFFIQWETFIYFGYPVCAIWVTCSRRLFSYFDFPIFYLRPVGVIPTCKSTLLWISEWIRNLFWRGYLILQQNSQY